MIGAIRSALREQLKTVVAESITAFENVNYDPTPGVPWVRERILPAQPEVWTLGERQEIGIYQVDVFVPAGGDTTIGDSIAASVRGAFEIGREMTKDGVTVGVRWSTVQPSTQDGDWYQVPVDIHWQIMTGG